MGEVISAELFFEDTPELQEFEPLPKGQHLFQVTDDIRFSTAKTGRGRFGLKVKIVGGEHDGRVGWYNLNMPAESDAKDAYLRKLWKKLAEIAPDAVSRSGVKKELLEGLQFKALIEHEEYPENSGKMQARFKNESWIGMVTAEPAKAPDMFT